MCRWGPRGTTTLQTCTIEIQTWVHHIKTTWRTNLAHSTWLSRTASMKALLISASRKRMTNVSILPSPSEKSCAAQSHDFSSLGRKDKSDVSAWFKQIFKICSRRIRSLGKQVVVVKFQKIRANLLFSYLVLPLAVCLRIFTSPTPLSFHSPSDSLKSLARWQ